MSNLTGWLASASLLTMAVAAAASAIDIVELNTKSEYNAKYVKELSLLEAIYAKLVQEYTSKAEKQQELGTLTTPAFGQYRTIQKDVSFLVDCGPTVYQDLSSMVSASPAYIHDVSDGVFAVSKLYWFKLSTLMIPSLNYTDSRSRVTEGGFAVIVVDPACMRLRLSVSLRYDGNANVTAVDFPAFEFNSSVISSMKDALSGYCDALTMPVFKRFVQRYKPVLAKKLYEQFHNIIKFVYFYK